MLKNMRPRNGKKDDIITLNVSGVRYQLQKSGLHKFPGSLLDRLAWSGKTDNCNNDNDKPKDSIIDSKNENIDEMRVKKDKNHIFVQRVPQMFELIVLQTYVTGKLHVPKWMCPRSVLEELKFWQLDIEHACSCCETDETNEESDNSNGDSDESQSFPEEKAPLISSWEKFRRHAWDFFDIPTSSISAMVYSVVSLLFVFLSTAIFVAGSTSEKGLCVGNQTVVVQEITNISFGADSDNNLNTSSAISHRTLLLLNRTVTADNYFLDDSSDTDGLPVFFSNCRIMQILQVLEMTCVVWFTVELLLRLCFCPKWSKFFKQPLNIIDVLATLPFYIEVALAYLQYNTPSVRHVQGIFVLIRVLRSLRVFRILKLARYFEELRILGKTLKAAKDELCMLGLFVFITVFIFSSIMYQLEKDEPDTSYTSLPASCWWGIVTLTTVGYGDMYPKTIGGKVLASVACVAGIIITAFPVSILVEHFTVAYKSKSQPMFIIRRLKMSGKQMLQSKVADKVIARKAVSV